MVSEDKKKALLEQGYCSFKNVLPQDMLAALREESSRLADARLEEDRTKNRVTVYYLLAQHFGLLSVFGGVAGAAGAAAPNSPPAAGAGAVAPKLNAIFPLRTDNRRVAERA